MAEYSELIWQLLIFFTLFVSAGLGAPFPEESTRASLVTTYFKQLGFAFRRFEPAEAEALPAHAVERAR